MFHGGDGSSLWYFQLSKAMITRETAPDVRSGEHHRPQIAKPSCRWRPTMLKRLADEEWWSMIADIMICLTVKNNFEPMICLTLRNHDLFLQPLGFKCEIEETQSIHAKYPSKPSGCSAWISGGRSKLSNQHRPITTSDRGQARSEIRPRGEGKVKLWWRSKKP